MSENDHASVYAQIDAASDEELRFAVRSETLRAWAIVLRFVPEPLWERTITRIGEPLRAAIEELMPEAGVRIPEFERAHRELNDALAAARAR